MIKKTALTLVLLIAFATTSFTADWELDKAHSSVGFSVKHMVVSKTKGNFSDFEGKASFETNNFAKGNVTFTIKMASIDTDNQKRDDHLKSPDFFDVEKYPEMTFISTKVHDVSESNFKITGDLTIKDITKEVVFFVDNHGEVNDPWGNTRTGFTATSEINRQDFNITWSKVLETGGLIVGDNVNIELEVEWIKVKTDNASVN